MKTDSNQKVCLNFRKPKVNCDKVDFAGFGARKRYSDLDDMLRRVNDYKVVKKVTNVGYLSGTSHLRLEPNYRDLALWNGDSGGPFFTWSSAEDNKIHMQVLAVLSKWREDAAKKRYDIATNLNYIRNSEFADMYLKPNFQTCC